MRSFIITFKYVSDKPTSLFEQDLVTVAITYEKLAE